VYFIWFAQELLFNLNFCVEIFFSVGMASSGTGLFHVDAIVLDEVHYLSDISRGTVWEEIVSFFSHCFSSFLQRLYLLSVSKLVSVFQIRSGHLLSKGGSTYMPISYSCKSG
jgi:hypothetical protein